MDLKTLDELVTLLDKRHQEARQAIISGLDIGGVLDIIRERILKMTSSDVVEVAQEGRVNFGATFGGAYYELILSRGRLKVHSGERRIDYDFRREEVDKVYHELMKYVTDNLEEARRKLSIEADCHR